MRPLRLEIEGFTVYKKKQTIDFENLSFFVIQGKTGAGKTSIIDAITFALYGKVPRYGDARDTTSRVLSKGSNRMMVTLEFSVGGRRFKIERFYRVKPREDIVRVEEEGRRLNLKKSEVEKWVEGVTGLDYRTFTKVILLPQGEFDRFLKPSAPRERREILINLLNLEIFEKIRRIAQDSYKELEGELTALRSEYEALKEASEETLKKLEEERERLEKRIEEGKKKLSEIEERLRLARERDGLEEELEKIRERLKHLSSEEEKIKELEEKLSRARRVLPYRPYIERLESVSKELRDLRLKRDKLLKDKIRLEEELRNVEEEARRVEREYSQLSRLREELGNISRDRERLSLAREEVRYIAQARRQIEEKEKLLDRREAVLRECEERLSRGERLIEEVKSELETLEFDEEEFERLLKEVERKKSLLEQKERLEELTKTLRDLRQKEESLLERLEGLKKELEREEERLRRENLKVYARHIREHLREGDACPVCGGEFRGWKGSEADTEIGKIEGRVKELQKEVTDLEKELFSTEARIQSLEEERKALSSKLKGWEEVLKIDIEGRLKDLESRKRKKRELEEKLRRYNERLNQLLREREEALREVERLKSEIESLRRSVLEREGRLRSMVGGLPSEEELGERIGELERREKDLREKIEEVERRREEVRSYTEELSRDLVALDAKLREVEKLIRRLEEDKMESNRRLAPLFEEIGDLEAIKDASMSEEEIRALEEKINTIKREKEDLERREEEVARRLSGFEGLPPTEEIQRDFDLRRGEIEGMLGRLGELRSELQQKREMLKRKEEVAERISKIERELRVLGTLREDLRSDRLQDFAASLMLGRIVERASEYLFNFTNNYELVLGEGGELAVFDRTQGVERDVKSLSGGETFLASLSLALGVSDVLSANANLESLFIDEGFGSLDEETRERVSDMLELIRQRINRMVGIISHIPDLAERFHQRIVVKRHGDFSTVEVIY